MAPTYTYTIVYTTGEFTLLEGQPSDHGLPNATAAHSFTKDTGVAVFYTVGCELTGEEVRALAARWLKGIAGLDFS